MNYCGNLEIDRCHHLIRHLDNSHLYTQLMKIFRHLQSDKTSSDDNGFLHFLTAGPRFDPICISHIPEGKNTFGPNPFPRWKYRLGAR